MGKNMQWWILFSVEFYCLIFWLNRIKEGHPEGKEEVEAKYSLFTSNPKHKDLDSENLCFEEYTLLCKTTSIITRIMA